MHPPRKGFFHGNWLSQVIFVEMVVYVSLAGADVIKRPSSPIGITPSSLPLDAICRTAEIRLAPHLSEPAPTARNGRLFSELKDSDGDPARGLSGRTYG